MASSIQSKAQKNGGVSNIKKKDMKSFGFGAGRKDSRIISVFMKDETIATHTHTTSNS